MLLRKKRNHRVVRCRSIYLLYHAILVKLDSIDVLKLKLCFCFHLCFRSIGDPRLFAQQGGWIATKEQLIRMNNKLCRRSVLPPFTNMGNYKMGTPDPHDDFGPHNVEFWVGNKITNRCTFWDNWLSSTQCLYNTFYFCFSARFLFLLSLLSLARISFSPGVKKTAICRE